ncbi:MAG: hypothetical protein ACKVGW_16265 [Verrucomicrobiia bacterium]|jgi:hypothetical protein
MTFTDTTSAHRNAQRRSHFGEAGRFGVQSGLSASARQSVNISPETMERVAKRKLASAIVGKVGYNRSGAIGGTETLGLYLSETA